MELGGQTQESNSETPSGLDSDKLVVYFSVPDSNDNSYVEIDGERLGNIMYTFFETYDFAGKTIVPFNTHGGSGFSNTIQTIEGLEPEASMLEGKSISRNAIEGAEQEIIGWLSDIGMMK